MEVVTDSLPTLAFPSAGRNAPKVRAGGQRRRSAPEVSAGGQRRRSAPEVSAGGQTRKSASLGCTADIEVGFGTSVASMLLSCQTEHQRTKLSIHPQEGEKKR